MPETQVELAIKLVKLEICHQHGKHVPADYNCKICKNRKFCKQYDELVLPIEQREEAKRIGL